MRTCLALWNNDLYNWGASSLSSEAILAPLNENNIVCLFDGSNHSSFFSSKLPPNSVLDYEALIIKYLSVANLDIAPSLPIEKLPIATHQLKILKKLKGRHIVNSLSEEKFYKLALLLYAKYQQFLACNHVDFVLYPEIPHTFGDYLFYIASLNYGAKSFALEMVGQIGRGLSYLFDMNSWRVCTPRRMQATKSIRPVNFYDVIESLKTKNGRPPYSSLIEDNAIRVLKNVRSETLNALNADLYGFYEWINNRAAARRYLSNHSIDPKHISCDAAIFFLHVEPESTVTPEAYPYCNQLDAITEFVSIAKNLKLVPYVKEHPDQYKTLYPYYSNMHWQNPRFSWVARDVEFYSNVISITGNSRCFIVDRCKDSIFESINIKIIGTLNGSIGLEGIHRGINVYAYGHPWYCFHRNVNTPQSYPPLIASDFTHLFDTHQLTQRLYVSNISLISEILLIAAASHFAV